MKDVPIRYRCTNHVVKGGVLPKWRLAVMKVVPTLYGKEGFVRDMGLSYFVLRHAATKEVPTNHEEKKEYAVNVLQITKYNGVAVSCCCFHQQFEEGEEVANSCPVTEQFQRESFAICLSRGNSPLCKVNNVFMMFRVLQFVRKRLWINSRSDKINRKEFSLTSTTELTEDLVVGLSIKAKWLISFCFLVLMTSNN